MNRRSTVGSIACLVTAALVLQGCGAYWTSRKGHEAARQSDWDMAVAQYTLALKKKPEDIGYKINLENARIQASRAHHDEARKHIQAELFEKAEEELKIAANYDPSNRGASDELAMVRKRIEAREEEKAERAGFEERRKRAAAGRYPLPTLSPRSLNPIKLKFPETTLEKILRSLGDLSGVNILFDPDFKTTTKASVELSGVTFEQALDQITRSNKLFYKVVDQNSIIIVQESPAKRKTYDELVLRTFYLQHADPTEVLNLVKTVSGITKIQAVKDLKAITALGTPDRIAIAERIIESLDKPRGEVVVEIKILEVGRNKAKEYGLKLSAYKAGATYSPGTAVQGAAASTGDTSGGTATAVQKTLTDVRAHFLSSLNLADFIVSIPSNVFASFLQTDTTARILAAPRLRAAEGKPTTFKVGSEVPVPTTQFSGYGGTSYPGASTSYQYRNVGVNMKLEPKVNPSGDIELQMEVEFSLEGTPKPVSGQLLPSFLTRNVAGMVRVKDGETSLLGGLLLTNEKKTFDGIFGLQSVPLLNRVFTSTSKTTDDTEVIISITPHIVRGPKLGPEDLVGLMVGTEEAPRVKGARPALFGPPDPEDSGTSGGDAPSQPAGAGQPGEGGLGGSTVPSGPRPSVITPLPRSTAPVDRPPTRPGGAASPSALSPVAPLVPPVVSPGGAREAPPMTVPQPSLMMPPTGAAETPEQAISAPPGGARPPAGLLLPGTVPEAQVPVADPNASPTPPVIPEPPSLPEGASQPGAVGSAAVNPLPRGATNASLPESMPSAEAGTVSSLEQVSVTGSQAGTSVAAMASAAPPATVTPAGPTASTAPPVLPAAPSGPLAASAAIRPGSVGPPTNVPAPGQPGAAAAPVPRQSGAASVPAAAAVASAAGPARPELPGASPAVQAGANPAGASASGRVSQLRALLSPNEVRVKAGETALVSIVLTGAQDLKSTELVLTWTPGAMEVGDVTAGALLTLDSSPLGSERAMEAARLTARFVRPTGTSGSGVVANATLRGLRPGVAQLRLESLVVGGAKGETSATLPEPIRVEVLP